MSRWHQKPPLGLQIDWSHPLARGLVGCWLMNEGSGNRIYDLSGNGNHGLISDGAVWDRKEGGSLAFDTVGRVNCYNPASFKCVDQMTISVWVYITSKTGWRTIVSKMDEWWFGNNNLKSAPCLYIGPALTDYEEANNDLVLNQMHHCVAVYQKASVILYVNGQKVPSTTNGSIPASITPSAGVLSIGYDIARGLLGFSGCISNTAIWHRALTPQGVMQLYSEPYCFMRPVTRSPSIMPMFNGHLTFDRVAAPAGSWWPSRNPKYGGGYERVRERRQPRGFATSGDVYIYSVGTTNRRILEWAALPDDDVESLLEFIDKLKGGRYKFTFTDYDGTVYHNCRVLNFDKFEFMDEDLDWYFDILLEIEVAA